MAEIHKYPTLGQVLQRGNDAGSVEITNVDNPTSAQSVATKDYVDSAVPSTTDGLTEGSVNLYYTDLRADDRITAQKGVANGIVPLDSGTKIASTYLPAIAITNTYVVASQSAMLALTAETGDVAVRTDLNKSFILAGTDPTVLSDWQELLTPTNTVVSVNGQTGVVSLTTTDVSEGTNLYYTNTRGIGSTLTGFTSGSGTVSATDTILQALQKLDGNIALKANSASPTFTGTVTLDTIQASGSGGITLKSNSGSTIALLGAGGGTNTTFYGGVNVATQLSVGDVGVTGGRIEIHGSTSGTVGIDVLAAAGTWTLTLPDTAGTSGQVLTTDGAGNTSWTTVSGGGSFSWGATASGTSGTGIGLTIGASASASTTMQSHTWDNTQSSATYAQTFSYGTSTTAKYGQYHDLTTNTGAIPMYIYYNNGTAFTSPGIFFQKAAGATIGGSTGALKFATLVDINSRIGTGIYFEDLTGGTASTLSTAYGIRFGNGTTTASYAYLIKAGNLTNSTGYGYALSVGYISNGSGRGYMMECSYGAYVAGGYAYGLYVTNTGANGTGSTFAGIYVNALSVGASAYGYLIRAESLVAGTGANGYGMYIGYIMGNVSSGTGVGYYVNNLSLTNTNNIGAFWYLNNSQTSVASGYNRAASMADMRSTRSVDTAGATINDTYNVSEWRRYNGATKATATMNAAGAIGYFENAVYGTTTGTLNDTVNPIRIVQHSLGSGAPIAITQNYVTSTNFRKLETETNTGKSIWVSDGTNPNGALTGTAGDILYGGDGGKIYYCTGTTNWVSSAGNPVYPSSLFTPGIVHYSDDAELFADVSSTNLRLYSSGLNLYNSGNAQSISVSTIWASAASYNGTITLGGYVYAMLRQTGVSSRIYRCSTSSDISVAGNWTQLTISGTSLPFGSTDGLCGYDGTYFYVTTFGIGFLRFTLSGTTLTYVDAYEVSGSSHDVTYDRVNSTGIYAKFATAPHIRFASHTGVLNTTKQSAVAATLSIALPNSFYTQATTGIYYLHNF